jgi:hypothetical protein
MLTELTNQNFYHYTQLKSEENVKDENMTIMSLNRNYYNNLNFENQSLMDYECQENKHEYFCNNQIQSKLEKRNARERKRVQQVNSEFQRLRKVLINKSFGEKVHETPEENFDDSSNLKISFTNPNKRISKVKILRYAIEYIKYLQTILMNENSQINQNSFFEMSSLSSSSSSNVEDFLDSKKQEVYVNYNCEDYIQYSSESFNFSNNHQNSFYENQNFNNNSMFCQNYNNF